MDVLERIERMRNGHGFCSGNYGEYKGYLRAEMRKVGRKRDAENELYWRLCRLEANVAKYVVIRSVKFLKSNVRMLMKEENSTFGEMYLKLMKAMIGDAVGNPVDIEELLWLRRRVLVLKSFVEQIDTMLEHPNYGFDLSSLKTKYMWKDVEIGFNGDVEKEAFVKNGAVPEGNGYDAVLARHVIRVERRKRRVMSSIESRGASRMMFIVCRNLERLLDALNGLDTFLRENLALSEDVGRMVGETEELLGYYRKLGEFVRFVKWDESIDTFVVPQMFKEAEEGIVQARQDASIVSRKYSRKAVFGYLEKYLRLEEENVSVPFLPIIFDIAADYVEYPVGDRKASELFKKLQLRK